METILIGLTALSLSISIILGVLLARVLREERRRSDARVNLLTQIATADDPPIEYRVAVPDFDLRPEEKTSASASTLFAEHDGPSAWPRRVLSAAAAVVVVGLLVAGWNAVDHRAPSAPQAASSAPQPLELLSLAHSQQADGLTITGLVQNPRTAGSVAKVEATALVFSADGTLLATGRAPLDFTTLAPGTESPFVIRVAAKRAARYRVAFRGADGQPLAHVDRRLEAVARKELP